MAVGLEGEEGGAVLEAADGGEGLVGGEEGGGDAAVEEVLFEDEVPAPRGN